MDISVIKVRLHLFNQRANKLSGKEFTKEMLTTDIGVSLSWQAGRNGEADKTVSHRRGPGENNIESFVATLRPFLLNKDQYSIKKVAECYEADNIPPEAKAAFKAARKFLNDFLGGETFFSINVGQGEEKLTHQRIFDIYTYGDIIHTDEDKRVIYELFALNPGFKNLIDSYFVVIIQQIHNIIDYMRQVNESVLKTL